MTKPKVSIVILNWNGLEDTLECLNSLRKITYPDYEVIVIDNASSGDDVKAFREKFGDYIQIIENDANYGYSKGYTIGMEKAFAGGAQYVLLLHNDAVVAPDFLGELVSVAEEYPEYGILSAINYSYKQPDKIQNAGQRARWFGLRSVEVSKQYNREAVQECIWVPLTCLLFEKEKVARMGVIPAMRGYFLYGDHIWHISTLRSKLKIGCVSRARIWHKGSQSLKRAGWSRMKWILRDNIILRYRFLSPRNIKGLTPSQFIYFALWLFIQRIPSFLGLVVRSLPAVIKLGRRC